MKYLAPIIICLWVAAATPIRSVEGILWLLWQALLWSYRVVKALRLSFETGSNWFGSIGVVENIESGPNCWELFTDHLKPPHKRNWEPK